MKKEYDYEKEQRRYNFKYYTFPTVMHYITLILTLFFAGIGFICSTTEWNIDITYIALLCIALILSTVIFDAWEDNIRLDNYRDRIINKVENNIQNCQTLNLTDEEKECLKMIVTKDI